jgi:dTDP-4-dehydrorhamnose 3,5-epimerase
MTIAPTPIPEVLVLEPKIFEDARGAFFEAYNRRRLAEAGIGQEFVQDNQSISKKNVLRGLHYQIRQPQGKLIRVLRGEIFDVAVDCRRSSPHFGHSIHVTLSAANRKMLWIPEGFAHGFLVVSETADVLYKTTDFYAPEFERTLLWNDPHLSISWPTADPLLSDKDRQGRTLADAETFE